ncbi:MAG: hypothetical protein IT289_05430 [Oligoflexia bacterium]|nr:hypothetical protein [Oligoflexia bacterium]
MIRPLSRVVLVIVLIFISFDVWAWGRKGHQIVAESAASILKMNGKAPYLKERSFDLGVYANVPDIVWKNIDEVRGPEGPLHYFDWNKTLESVFGRIQDVPASHDDFKNRLGSMYDPKNGLALWRISELVERCSGIAKALTAEKRGLLISCIGILSHYTGDLAQPLHATDNHDGQLSQPPQKGIHSFFEDTIVDELATELHLEVEKFSLKEYAEIESMRLGTDNLMRWLVESSYRDVKPILAIDSKVGRADIAYASRAYKKLVRKRLAIGAAVTALVWQEILAPVKSMDLNRYFFYDGRPEYIWSELTRPTGR